MGGVARSAIARRVPSTRQARLAGMVVTVLAEFRRARAAAQRYEDLRIPQRLPQGRDPR